MTKIAKSRNIYSSFNSRRSTNTNQGRNKFLSDGNTTMLNTLDTHKETNDSATSSIENLKMWVVGINW
jgi:hypothetical protein